VLVDGHQEPFVVVEALLSELLTELVLPKPEDVDELEDVASDVVEAAAVDVVVVLVDA